MRSDFCNASNLGGGSFLFLLLAMPGIEKDVLYTVDVAGEGEGTPVTDLGQQKV
jgi:hypothetical protein